MKKYLILTVVLLLTACGMQSTNVSALYWKRTIPIEHWQQNTHEGWDIPAGGTKISEETRAHGSYNCDPHQIKRNGKLVTEWDSCTRWDTWYTYTIWEWTVVRKAISQDDSSTYPYWQTDYTLGDNERLGQRIEEYHIVARYGCDITVDLGTWSSLEIGESIQTDCRSITR